MSDMVVGSVWFVRVSRRPSTPAVGAREALGWVYARLRGACAAAALRVRASAESLG